MRIAIYHNLPPGGALRVLCDFVRRAAGEHELDLYTVDLGRFDGFSYARGRAEQHDLTPHVARTFRYPVLRPAASRVMALGPGWQVTGPGWLWRVERRIAGDIDARSYDVVLVCSCRLTHSPSLLQHLRTPSLYYMQEPRRRTFEVDYQPVDQSAGVARKAVAGGIERIVRRADHGAVHGATRLATNSCYSAEYIQRSYGRDAEVCYLGVETEVFRLDGGVGARRPSVMSVGALDASKGHALVVEALALLPEASRPALDVVYERCDDRYRSDVQTLATDTGVELRLHSGISDTELAGMYATASATAVGARLEPFGLVALESLACGTPVVAVREAGLRETVDHGVNGYLVPRSPADMADGLTRILAGDLHRTPEQLRATVVPKWSAEGATKRMLEQLGATIDEHRR
ncbi:MAG: glycosyltransferase [Acidimicrobiales bacterium]